MVMIHEGGNHAYMGVSMCIRGISCIHLRDTIKTLEETMTHIEGYHEHTEGCSAYRGSSLAKHVYLILILKPLMH